MRIVFVSFTLTCLVAASASATTFEPPTSLVTTQPRDVWRVNWLGTADTTTTTTPVRPVFFAPALEQDAQPVHAAAVEHSDGYLMRAKIHRYASWATLPLFATELALGQSLYNGTDSDWKKGMHGAVGAGIVGLFALNTVTGVWNLFGESWNDEGRGLRLVHGLLMMAADAGFVATSMTTPEHEGGFDFQANRSTHRNLAVTSIGLGTAGYLIMLIGSH